MFKEISLSDIKIMTRKNPYEVAQAVSNENGIAFYFNPTQRICVIRESSYDYRYRFQETITDSTKKNNTNMKGKNTGEEVKAKKSSENFYAFLFLFVSFLLTFVFVSIFYHFVHTKYAYMLGFSLSCIFTFRIGMVIILHNPIANENARCSAALKSNHAAEHMIINFLKRHHRLPRNMRELRRASQVDVYCDTKDSVLVCPVHTVIAFLIVSVANLIVSLLLTISHSSNSFILCSCTIFLFIAYIICVKEKIGYKTFGNFFFIMISCIVQYRTMPKKNVTKESLLMAYITAANWFFVVFPKEFDLKAYNNFFKNEKIRIRYK